MFLRYAQLKRQMAELEDELRELQPQIAEAVKKQPDAKLKTDYGLFSIQRRAKWTYSEVVQQIEEQLKVKQQAEQKDGTAQAEYAEFVMFKSAAGVPKADATRA